MNTQTEKALRMAIEALESAGFIHTENDVQMKYDSILVIEALYACKEALEQPAQEPQYLYVYADEGGINFSQWHTEFTNGVPYIGKIKLEVHDD